MVVKWLVSISKSQIFQIFSDTKHKKQLHLTFKKLETVIFFLGNYSLIECALPVKLSVGTCAVYNDNGGRFRCR